MTYEKGTNRLTKSYLMATGINGRLTNNTYTYDPAGNVTSILDDPTAAGGQRDAQCFDYDHLRRLTQAWTTTNPGDGQTACDTAPTTPTVGGPGAYWQEYKFSTNGNRAEMTSHATGAIGAPTEDTVSTYTYGAATGGPHQVREIVDTVAGVETGRRSYSYDDSGNTKTRPGQSGEQTLTWNPQGDLESVVEGGVTTSFGYDAEGARYLRRDANATTLYLPGMELSAPADGSTPAATRYYTLPGNITYVRTANSAQYQCGDHHSTGTTGLDPDTGAVTHRRLDPYGNPRGQQPNPGQWAGERGFVNGVQDPTGLTHLGAREYDPLTGRFISVDPIIDNKDPQQMNGYAYANNTPVSASDPDGLSVALDNDGRFTVPSTQKKYHKLAGQVQQQYNAWKKAQAEGRKHPYRPKPKPCTSWAWVCSAERGLSNAWDATKEFAAEHKEELIGAGVGIAVGVGCSALTLGIGTLACGALAGAVSGGLTTYLKGGDLGDVALGAAEGAAFGIVGGAAGAAGGAAIGTAIKSGAAALRGGGAASLRGMGGQMLGSAKSAGRRMVDRDARAVFTPGGIKGLASFHKTALSSKLGRGIYRKYVKGNIPDAIGAGIVAAPMPSKIKDFMEAPDPLMMVVNGVGGTAGGLW